MAGSKGLPPNHFGDPDTTEITEADPAYACCFCHRYEINPTEWGNMLRLGDIVTHYFCLLFSSGVQQHGQDDEGIHAFLPKDIWKEVNRAKRLTCRFCKGKNATVGCGIAKCPYSFHYSCGYEAGCLFQFHGQFLAFCPKHKPKQKIPVRICKECPICMMHTEEDNAVWAPCCKKGLFHRRCLLYTAKAAGYFFKCPLCNSTKSKFIQAMKMNGVYIPQQDAAWELEPNAFQELMTNYSQCDAKLCLCPDGRQFVQKVSTKDWYLVRCHTCGASATHKTCSNLTELNWKCRGCRKVFKKTGVIDPDDEGLSSCSDSDSDNDDSSSEDNFRRIISRLPSISSIISNHRVSAERAQMAVGQSLKLNPVTAKLEQPVSVTLPSSNCYEFAPAIVTIDLETFVPPVGRPTFMDNVPASSDYLIQLQMCSQLARMNITTPEHPVTPDLTEATRMSKENIQAKFRSKSSVRSERRAQAQKLRNEAENVEDSLNWDVVIVKTGTDTVQNLGAVKEGGVQKMDFVHPGYQSKDSVQNGSTVNVVQNECDQNLYIVQAEDEQMKKMSVDIVQTEVDMSEIVEPISEVVPKRRRGRPPKSSTHGKNGNQPVTPKSSTHGENGNQPVTSKSSTHGKNGNQPVTSKSSTHGKNGNQPVTPKSSTHGKNGNQPVTPIRRGRPPKSSSQGKNGNQPVIVTPIRRPIKIETDDEYGRSTATGRSRSLRPRQPRQSI